MINLYLSREEAEHLRWMLDNDVAYIDDQMQDMLEFGCKKNSPEMRLMIRRQQMEESLVQYLDETLDEGREVEDDNDSCDE